MISSLNVRRIANAAFRNRIASASANNLKCSSVFHSNFSTKPEQEQMLFMPPNLTIDRKTSASPFAGLEIISKEDPQDDSEALENISDDSVVALSEKDAYDLDDNKANGDEGTYYSLANKPEPKYAIPLPERLKVPIINFSSAAESGTIHLSEHVFGEDPIRTDILHRCVVYYRNKKRGKRNGGARTKTIGEVSGSGKKVRNQKGGGIARAGHKRPAHWRGGAKAHGPKGSIQNYETKLNKKVRKIGLRMALSQKLKEGNLILVDSFSNVGTYKTKVLAQTVFELGGIGGHDGTSGFFVDHVEDEDEDDEDVEIISLEGCDINLKVGSANIMRTKVTNQRNMNVYDVLKYEKLVISLSALEQIENRYNTI